MSIQKTEMEMEQEFHISSYIIFYKFVLGILELILGVGLLLFGNQLFTIYYNFRYEELLENSGGTAIRLLENIVPFLLEHKGYIILLLLLLGITKVIGAVALYYKKHWGLDLLIGLTFFLLPFDLIDLFRHPTLTRVIYFLINIFIALYLVNFRPHHYLRNLKTRFNIK